MITCGVSRLFRGGFAISVTGLAVLAVRAALLPWLAVPEPSVPDEYSYLLMGDTFASGRLSNPAHPLWVHFETIFVLHQPTYASVYPVAQGVILAAGKRLLGHPWLGVCLSVALMCGAICWMLQGWLPARWALLGSFCSVLQLGPASYWMNSYWGGAHAALGGALVIGALPRLAVRRKTRDSILLALGLCVLANSRPYEGAVVCLPALGFLLTRKLSWKWFWAPVALILAANFALMGLYFSRVTGKFWKLPQQEYIEQYGASATFLWQTAPPEPAFRHSALQDFFLVQRAEALAYQTTGGAAGATLGRFSTVAGFYLGPLMLLPVLSIPLLRRKGKTRFLALTAASVFFAISLTGYHMKHYAAPMTCVLIALAMQSLRYLSVLRRWGNPVSRLLLPVVPLILMFHFYQQVASSVARSAAPGRTAVEKQLRRQSGSHLVFVRYAQLHNVGTEWVYNAANIDGAPIVWARDMGPERNRELIDYFPSRSAWLASPEAPAPLRPY